MLGDEKADEATKRKPKFKLPKGFDDESSFLEAMRLDFADDAASDRLNGEAALEDLQFMVADQWPDYIRMSREAAGKPVITVNRIPAFVAQIVGARRMNETEIKVVPDNGGTVAIARVREGLMRSMQKTSHADIAYDKALENSAICGIGNFQLEVVDDQDDVWVRSHKISEIPDALSVLWDRMMFDKSGRDAGHCFVIDKMPRSEFSKRWPWATPADISMETVLRGEVRMSGWFVADEVRVVSYHRMETKDCTLALFDDGSTRDITDNVEDSAKLQALLPNIMQHPGTGAPMMREVKRKECWSYLCSGTDILEGPYVRRISRVPVFRVPGWEVNVGEWKHRWGLVRFLKDPQRMHNFSRSMWAEKMMQTPRAVWLARHGAVAGREKDFRASHLSDDPLLIYNDDAAEPPVRVQPAAIEQAWIGVSEQTAQDIKDVSNIHEANLGMPSNEVSGAAIMARQRVSDTGTILYHDNLTYAIEECGRTADEEVPYIYDSPRIIKILGSDAKQDMQIINASDDPRSIDITAGKYSVSVVAGPSYATKRMEALASMTSLANAAPQSLATFMDLYVQAMDMPMGDEIAKRIRKTMPIQLLEPDEITPEMQQRAQGQAQQQHMQIQMAVQKAMADWQKTQSETALNSARAQNFQVEAASEGQRIQNESITTASQAAERELAGHLESLRVASGK